MDILEFIHLIILFYLSLGGYFIPTQYIPVYLLSLPYIVIDWNDRDGICWVTKLTNMVKYRDMDPEVEDHIENSFITSRVQSFAQWCADNHSKLQVG